VRIDAAAQAIRQRRRGTVLHKRLRR
jgi:hypothetical protein